MENTSTFKSNHSNEVYQIKKNFNCNSKLVVYLIECRFSGKQYNGSTVTKFRARDNNYKRTHHNFRKEKKLQARNQKRFHEHYLQSDHNGICDWKITVIDHAETEKWFTFSPVSVLLVISVLFVVIVIVIVKNDHSYKLYFLFFF